MGDFVFRLVILAICLAILMIPVLAIAFSIRENIRIRKIPLPGLPQTTDEYLALEQRIRIAKFKRYWAWAFIILIFPFLLCCALIYGPVLLAPFVR